jgi:hypothetical protein
MMTIATLKAAVLALLLQAPAHWSDADEAPTDRAARLDVAAADIAEASLVKPAGWGRTWPALDVAAAMVNLGQRESQWARYVAGGCQLPLPVNPRTGKAAAHCDRGRAHAYWQVWAVGCPALVGVVRGSREEQVATARCSARLFVAALVRCKEVDPDVMVGAYAGYRSKCDIVDDTRDRARTHYEVKTKLRAALRRK